MRFEGLRELHTRLLAAIHGIAADQLGRVEREGAWSIRDVIAHLSDLELLTAVRLRLMLADDVPALPSFARNEWVSRLHRGATTADLLEDLWFHRRRNLALLESLAPEELERRGEHPAYGVMSVAALAGNVAAHQEKHHGQIERIKATLGLKAEGVMHTGGVEANHIDGAPVRSPGDGIRVRDVWRNGVRSALVVDIDAGAVWPELDRHVPGPEEVYVVSGEFHDGASSHPAGTFLHNPAGSSHVPQSRSGCQLFIYYPEG